VEVALLVEEAAEEAAEETNLLLGRFSS